MAFLGKTYNYEKHEKFDEFLKSLGLPQEKIDQIIARKSKIIVQKNGDTYTQSLLEKSFDFQSGVELDEEVQGHLVEFSQAVHRTRPVTAWKSKISVQKNCDTYTQSLLDKSFDFQSGVEFDEEVQGHLTKATIVIDGNNFTQTQKFPDGGVITFKREYSGDKLVVACTNSKWDGIAYRYYSA